MKPQTSPKERILKTADRLFYEQGYLATGINQIIADARVAKASFYQHFPSKEDLLMAYIAAHNAELFGELYRVIKPHDKAKAKVIALFDYLMVFTEQTEFRGCAFVNLTAEFPEPDSQPRQRIAQFKTDLRDFIEQLIQTMKPVDPVSKETAKMPTKLLSDTIFLLFEAAMVESRIHHKLWPIEASRSAVQQLLR
ncbi:MAG: TetR/AcrR family transcriptional regulator [Cyanobacteria bacterium P01_D01_bin.44]